MFSTEQRFDKSRLLDTIASTDNIINISNIGVHMMDMMHMMEVYLADVSADVATINVALIQFKADCS